MIPFFKNPKIISIDSILVTVLILVLLISCKKEEKKVKHNPIKELDLVLNTGYSSFIPYYNKLYWKEELEANPIEGFYKNTYEKIEGIDSSWQNFGINQLRVNEGQFMYQNLKNNKLGENIFKAIMNRKELDTLHNDYTKKMIKAILTVVIYKDESGQQHYKIDTNHDNSILDEQEHIVKEIDLISDIDSFAKSNAHDVWYEKYIDGQIERVDTKITIYVHKSGAMVYNFPVYGTTVLDKTNLVVNSGFTTPDFKYISDIVFCKKWETDSTVVRKNEFFKINGNQVYKNLGVENSKLKLLKIPLDSIFAAPQVGFKAPIFKGINFTTKDTIQLSDYYGKYLYVDAWGSWCKPCIEEIPNLKSAYQNLDKSRIEFIGLAYDIKTTDLLIKALDKYGLEWPQILMTEELKALYNVQKFPSSFLIDPKGDIIAKDLRGENLKDTLFYYIQEHK